MPSANNTSANNTKANNTALDHYEVWFLTGSQHLYGAETLRQVDAHSEEIVRALNCAGTIPVQIVFKPVVTTSEEIHAVCLAANAAANCVGERI